MTDQWVPGPGCTPVPPDGIPPANTWTPADSCAPPSGPSITGGVIITGVPATIGSMVNGQYAWTITLNDGQSPPNFSIDRYSGGALVDHPIFISGVDGSVTFTGAVTLAEDPTEPLQAATKEYVDLHSAGVTEAPVDGQLYGRQDEGWAVVPPPPVLEAPTDGQAYVRQSQAWAPLSASMAGYLPIAGGRMTGGIQMDGSLSNRWIVGSTAGSLRWAVNYGDGTAESGSNAGSNFTIQNFSDAGVPLGTPLAIARATGAITVGVTPGIAPLTLNGAQGSWRSVSGQTNGSIRWQMYLGDFGAELGSNAGSNFRLSSYTDAGGALASPLVIARATGVATFSALPSFPGGANGQALITNGSGVLSWGAAGIGEAPTDGQQYARQNAAWTPFVSGPPTTISDTAPASPSVGQLWWDSVGGQLYVWYSDANTSQWVVAVNAASRPPPASTTTLGSVKVDGTSIQAAPDGTISTVLVPMGDNRVINGDMRIDQRGVASGAGGTVNGYTIDRWAYDGSPSGLIQWQRMASTVFGYPYCLSAKSLTAHTIAAGDFSSFNQPIEADMVSDFAWGTAGAQPVTLSFLVQASLTGSFSGSLQNYAATRSYPFSFSLPTANTWTKIAITIPGDTAGTWVMSGNGVAIYVNFDLGCGTTYRGPAGAWAAGNYIGVTGAVSLITTNGATFYITGVKLEIGSIATPFNHPPLAQALAACQRYYQTGTWGMNSAGYASQVFGGVQMFPVTMRGTPTMALSGQGGYNIGTITSNGANAIWWYPVATATATAYTYATVNWTASVEL